jgi:hypothetical protein
MISVLVDDQGWGTSATSFGSTRDHQIAKFDGQWHGPGRWSLCQSVPCSADEECPKRIARNATRWTHSIASLRVRELEDRLAVDKGSKAPQEASEDGECVGWKETAGPSIRFSVSSSPALSCRRPTKSQPRNTGLTNFFSQLSRTPTITR